MRNRRSVIVGLSAAAMVVASPLVNGAAPPPDLTGVWAPVGSVNASAADAAARSLPLKPEARARHETFNAIVAPTGDTPGGVCLGAGMPGILLGGGGYPMEIIQRPDQITIIFELHGVVRHVYFGARNAAEADRLPSRVGYSSGRWDADVLVVDTNNLAEALDQRATPHSADATIVERYHVEGPDSQGRRVLVVDVTVTDPAFYTEPLKLTRRWTEVPNGRLLPYDCNEEVWYDRVEELARKAGLKVP